MGWLCGLAGLTGWECSMVELNLLSELVVYGPLGILSAVALYCFWQDRKDTRAELKKERAERKADQVKVNKMLTRATKALEQSAKSMERMASAIERLAPARREAVSLVRKK